MKKLLVVLFVGVLALGLSAGPAQAIALTYGDAYYLGRVDDGVPSGDADSAGYINYLKTLAAGTTFTPYLGETYDRLSSAVAGPFPTAVYVTRDNSGNNTINATGYAYVLAKYGNNPSLVWFVNGAVGSITVPSSYVFPSTNTGGGLSHIALFNLTTTVPDGGATLMLLGGALVGLGALRRKFRT